MIINAIDLVMCTIMSNKIIFVSALVFWLSACTNVEPYIFKPDEFNRGATNFATKLKDRSKLEICYNKWATTPEILTQMATDECGRFGKVAHFIVSRPLICSFSAPAQAVYSCLCPDETSQSRRKRNPDLSQKKEKQGCSKL
jgi:hypothetical protein